VVFPSGINTVYSEFCPMYYDNGLVFVSNRPNKEISSSDKGNNPGYLKWFFTQLEEDSALKSILRFSKEHDIKTNFNEGPLVFYDNDQEMIFTQNAEIKKDKKEDVVVHPVQLYSATRDNENNWVATKALDFCDKRYSFGQPAITSDGKTLIFSSNMPGGHGGADLYMSKRKNNIWQKPENLGDNINSKGDEMFPYILNDSILYFSSNGHGGLGGLDICYIPLFNTGKVFYFGVPLNSPHDDFGIVFDEDEMSGFLSSNREGSKGRDDIYAFRIIRVLIVLKIVDLTSSTPVSNAEVFSITDIDENLLGKTDEDGYCNIIIPVSKEIRIMVKKEDFTSQVFTFEPMKFKPETTVVLHVENSNNLAEEINTSDTVIYKVQILARRKPASPRQIKKKYKGPMPVNMSYEDNWYKYTIGEFETYKKACECLESCNVSDAFIAVYINNIRVDVILANSETNEEDSKDTNKTHD
jgi:hypothetical protein